MIKCVLFDCDGTLVDSELMCAQAFTKTVTPYGVECSPEIMLTEYFGVPNIEIAARLAERHGVDLPDDGVITAGFTKNVFDTMAAQMRVLEDSVTYVRSLKERGIALAVGSNGTKDVVLEELRVAGFLDIIPPAHVFTVVDVENAKPAPDMYLKAAAACGVAPEHCVVVEDSATGARAGLAAGMRVVGYTGLAHNAVWQRQALENAGVTRIINTLSALDAHLL